MWSTLLFACKSDEHITTELSKLTLNIREIESEANASSGFADSAPALFRALGQADRSPARLGIIQSRRLELLDALSSIDERDLDQASSTLRHTLVSVYSNYSDLAALGHGHVSPNEASPFVFSHLHGTFAETPELLETQGKFKSLADAQDYIIQLDAASDAIWDEVARYRLEAKGRGALPPFLKERLEEAILGQDNVEAAANIWLQPMVRGLEDLNQSDEELKTALLNNARHLVKSEIEVALDALVAAINEPHAAASSNSTTQNWYPKALQLYGNSTRDTDELFFELEKKLGILDRRIHDIVDVLEDEIAKTQSGDQSSERTLTTDTPDDQDLVKRVQQALDTHFQTQETETVAPEGLLAQTEREEHFESLIKSLGDQNKMALSSVFLQPPVAPLMIEWVDSIENENYRTQSSDTPAILTVARERFADQRLSELPVWYAETVWPGHHLAASYKDDFHAIAYMFDYPAFDAGWRHYVRDLMIEFASHGSDRMIYLSNLLAQRKSLALAISDLGLHQKGWSNDETRDFLITHAGLTPDAALDTIADILVWPARALGAEVGYQHIMDMRIRAEQALGGEFDLAEFHEVVLSAGARPLNVVATDVEKWIETQITGD